MPAQPHPRPRILPRSEKRRRLTPEELRHASAEQAAEMHALVHALWHDVHGQWEIAHSIAQDDHTPNGSWVHAYLHRKEGDTFNAGYWYRRAGKPPCDRSLEAEWNEIAAALLP